MHAQKPRLRGVQTITDRPARIGKLKIGEKLSKTKANGQTVEYPSKLDYIKAVDGAGNRIAAFHTVFGEKPTEFRAMLPSNSPDDFWWEAYRRYGSGTGLVCHGDGRQAIVEETGETIECPCAFAEPTTKNGKEYPPACKPVCSLSLFLWEVPALGVFQIDTGSINSIKNIRWFLTSLPQLTGGQYAGIPFKVMVEPFQAMHDGKASTAYQWKLDLLPGYTPMNLRIAAEEAVGSYLIPPEVANRKLIDEGKPDDLYVGLPSPKDDALPPEPADAGSPEEPEVEIPEKWSSMVLGGETVFADALSRLKAPQAKLDSFRETQAHNRRLAESTGDWEAYHAWLTDASARFQRQAAKSAAQGELVP